MIKDILMWLYEALKYASEYRAGQRDKYFEVWVEPARKNAEIIYRDYLELLRTLRRKVETASRADPIIRYLEKRRQEVQPVRELIRAEIKQRMREGGVTRFEAGILGLVTGAVSAVDRPYFHVHGYDRRTRSLRPQPGSHTVLDLLAKLRRRGTGDIAPIRSELLRAITEKENGIESAWCNVSAGYAELRATLKLPRLHGRPARSATRREGAVLIEMYLQQIHQMLASHQFERELPKRLQEVVAKHLPELSLAAEDLREVIHDLNEQEPGVTGEMLESRLEGFERAFDDALRERRRRPARQRTRRRAAREGA